MPGETAIGWTDFSWNPVTGCSKVSSGCVHCYAETLSLKRGWTAAPWTAPNAEANVVLHPERLDAPRSWKTPRRVFVNSMSDLFHPLVPFEFVTEVFWTMRDTPQHTYQILTKRPERMRRYLVDEWSTAFGRWPAVTVPPLPNVWLGTSVEAQREADERLPHLTATPAAVRFLSCEPLLGPIDLTRWVWHRTFLAEDPRGVTTGDLDWVIAGGESGPGYRALNLEWVRSLRDQCRAAAIAFFYKQASGFRPGTGRLLDGRTWDEFPDVPAPEQLIQAVLL
jgi:protein gp37